MTKHNVEFGDKSLFSIEVQDAQLLSGWMIGSVKLSIQEIPFGSEDPAPISVFYVSVKKWLLKHIEKNRLSSLSEKLFHMECQDSFKELHHHLWGDPSSLELDNNSPAYAEYGFSPGSGEYLDDYFIMFVPYKDDIRVLVSGKKDLSTVQCFTLPTSELLSVINLFISWFDSFGDIY